MQQWDSAKTSFFYCCIVVSLITDNERSLLYRGILTVEVRICANFAQPNLVVKEMTVSEESTGRGLLVGIFRRHGERLEGSEGLDSGGVRDWGIERESYKK